MTSIVRNAHSIIASFYYLHSNNFKHGIFCELELHSHMTNSCIYECIGHGMCQYLTPEYPEIEKY